jgi:hypothetical protein
LTVCGHCRASLIRRDLDVKQVGRMPALLEDPSPLQLGAEGAWRGTHFAVVGRIQVPWEPGLSLIEEAFDWGRRAARRVLVRLGA